ncbi:MAG: NADH-quinone oxidoreductase subunit NuoE [Chloroflexota bacterium]
MLTEEEKREIDEEAARYEYRTAAAVDALKIVQRHRGGWVSEEALADTGEYLGMSPSDLDSVATFYNIILRKPVGRHIIRICNSVSCWIMGYTDVRRHIVGSLGIDLGGTTADGRFTFLPNQCLGCCDRAPAMMVDDDLHLDLTPARVDDILAGYR